ncbi:MAG: hypothetical protein AB7U38_13485 [Hyphomicrobiales bacterium]
MTGTMLVMTPALHASLWAHLLPPFLEREQAAFLFCNVREDGGIITFEAVEAALLQPSDFAVQYSDYIEITNECRIGLIKRAHALGVALAEFHSHTGPWPAGFSWSDRKGLRETVSHMKWRLKGKPYLAVVAATSGFDALAWLDDTPTPTPIVAIRAGSAISYPTNNSLAGWTDENARSL